LEYNPLFLADEYHVVGMIIAEVPLGVGIRMNPKGREMSCSKIVPTTRFYGFGLFVCLVITAACAPLKDEQSVVNAGPQAKADVRNGNFGILTRTAIKGRYICFARNLWKSDQAEFAQTGLTRAQATSNALAACGGTHGNNTNSPTGAVGCVISECYDLQLRGAGQVIGRSEGWICMVSTRPSTINTRYDPALQTFVGEGKTIKEAYEKAEEICKGSAGINCTRDAGCVDRSNSKLGRGTP
jgi:cytochrome c553